MRLLIAVLFSVALVTLVPQKQETPVNKVVSSTHVLTVQAKLSEPEPQAIAEEKAQTEPQATTTGAAEQSGIKPDVTPQTPTYPQTHEELMAAAGIQPADYGAVDYIISHESSWNPDATEPTTGAHGLPQALPYSKTGCGWSDAVCQLKWASDYAAERYGGWWGAYEQWVANRWW